MTMSSKKLIPEIQNYIDLVRSGKIAVCKEQILLCDYVEKCFNDGNIFVDEEQLHKYLSLQKYFPFKLLEWEVFCFTLHNCTYSKPGILRWPDLFILVGRGAGKNGYLSFEDFCLISEYNNIKEYNIDICANAKDQARTSFDDIYNILEENENKLKNHFYWNKEMIKCLKTGSVLRFRTSNAKTKDGGRPGKVDFDEYHQYEDYRLINVFKTGLGKKKNPRTTIISTNGDVRDGPLDHLIARAQQILNGVMSDNGLLPFICKLDDEKEVDNPKMWDKANPSLHYFPELRAQIEREYVDYKNDPISNSSFMTKRMNIPQGNKDIEVTSWENILATNQKIPDLTGCTCVAGLDYAKTTDFVTSGLLFRYKGKYYWLTHTWVCESCNDLGRIKAPLREWEKKGLLTFVKGPEIPPEIPAGWLAEQAKKYNITVLGMDNYRYTLLAKALREVGFDTDKNGANNIKLMRPSNQMLIAPVITSLFVNHNIVWGDNPLMRWYTNNACIITSASGNITYGKIEPKSRKTDGFMAFVAAMCVSGDLEDSGETIDFDFGVYTY
ncbi:Phage terminase-like protein, large subunit, contains N-terminal HTH domain [Caloramator quimbayensis]|uniref:Phage terminase-like protein, large subunit, contains N-terminal HTH domain n=1 Tax=Caloramator quimbayensis TaxID=1147123 RepID=A0A1T4YES7_9CLOT|nr:terminase TerL endonuclease subunit [Caloramator quimbayensis]SKA99811.1 Phage terminase-like protein, large subunit, contains N-terminal HTH domain [Caloramator quimbayensis]